MRHWIVRLTVLLLVVDALLAIAWCVTQCGALEPYITAIALIATITGLFIDRWLATLERRGELLYVLLHELSSNQLLYKTGAYDPQEVPHFTKHYDRLMTTSMEAAINSGAFNGEYDRHLFILIYHDREACIRTNEYFDFSERVMIQTLSMFGDASKTYEVIQNAIKDSNYLKRVIELNDAWIGYILVRYSQETGIEVGDNLFVPLDHPESPARRRIHPVRAWVRRRMSTARTRCAVLKTWHKGCGLSALSGSIDRAEAGIIRHETENHAIIRLNSSF